MAIFYMKVCSVLHWFDKCRMTCVHHCHNIQNSSTPLKKTLSSTYPSLCPLHEPLATTDLVTIFIVLSCPEHSLSIILTPVALQIFHKHLPNTQMSGWKDSEMPTFCGVWSIPWSSEPWPLPLFGVETFIPFPYLPSPSPASLDVFIPFKLHKDFRVWKLI